MLNHSDEVVRDYAKFLYDHDYSLYTAKQWGIDPKDVDPSVLKRVPVRFDYSEGYFDDEYQCMPKTTYTDFFRNILNHPNIEIMLNTDAMDILEVDIENKRHAVNGKIADFPVVYTGPIDELFKYCYGRLPYRSLRFEWKHEDIDSLQDMPVVAYPEAKDFTRITEYKKLPPQNVKGTTYAVEYPLTYDPEKENEPYYPLLTKESQLNYERYRNLISDFSNLYVCGRLGDFKYYNMDQALARALSISDSIIRQNKDL